LNTETASRRCISLHHLCQSHEVNHEFNLKFLIDILQHSTVFQAWLSPFSAKIISSFESFKSHKNEHPFSDILNKFPLKHFKAQMSAA
jgi:hypothetical protein